MPASGTCTFNPGTWFTPPAQRYRTPYESRQHLIRVGVAGPHRGTVRQRDRDRASRFCTAGARVVPSAQLQQAAPQTGLLGAGDLAGLQIDQSPATVTGQAGHADLRLLHPVAEHGFDRVAEDGFNGRHVIHATVARLPAAHLPRDRRVEQKTGNLALGVLRAGQGLLGPARVGVGSMDGTAFRE